MKPFKIGWVFLFGITTQFIHAQQFDASIQFRPRYEYRNGYKTFLPEGEKPASFISQRSRLNLNFENDTWQVYLSMQNNGVWGENDLAAANNKSTMAVFQAWTKYKFNQNTALKLGRQILSYDNQRILGTLDWAQQGLNHDAALLTYKGTNFDLHTGFALNAATESLEKKPYTPNNYKNMQYAWFHTNKYKVATSLLFLNTGYEIKDASEKLHTNYHQTWGTYLKYQQNKWVLSSGLYAQTGKLNNQKKEAYYASADFQYQITQKFTGGVGFEYLSGTSQNKEKVNRSFAPLYGTNHIFNGTMDYFNNGNFQNSVGLNDFYVNGKWQFEKFSIEVAPHIFYSDKPVVDANKVEENYLGTEIDITAVYQVQKDLKLTGGYSQLFASDSFEQIRGTNNGSSQWAWVMLTINPTIFSTKK